MTQDTPTPSVGIYGKHPAFGDFLGAGLPKAAQGLFEAWLNKVLPPLRDLDPATWESRYDGAPALRFWLGDETTKGAGVLCGTMFAARDKVGRRFPLVAAVAGSGQTPPVLDASQDLYNAIHDAVTGYTRGGTDGAADFAKHLLGQVAPYVPLQDGHKTDFWATRDDADMANLWADVASADHLRAASHRSYMWTSSTGGSALYVSEGLPTTEILNWMITDAVAAPLMPQTDVNHDQTVPPIEPADFPQMTV